MKLIQRCRQNLCRKPLSTLGLLGLLAFGRPGLAADGTTTSAATALAGETITSAGLVANAVSAFPACGRWQPTGICVYLVCSLVECHTEETVKYGHYNPDLVVSAYNSSSNDSVSGNPWTEAKSITGGLDAIGWRWQIPEQVYPQSVTPGLREVGSGLSYTWGNLYPRGGFTTQVDDAKSAAVIAQRVADIVTRTNQPHIYLPLNEGDDDSNQHADGDTMVWSPGPVTETDATNGWWQMDVPVAEQSCAVFGTDDRLSPAGWGGGKIARSGSYAFTLWRPYQCCSIEGLFLFSIGVPYPPSS